MRNSTKPLNSSREMTWNVPFFSMGSLTCSVFVNGTTLKKDVGAIYMIRTVMWQYRHEFHRIMFSQPSTTSSRCLLLKWRLLIKSLSASMASELPKIECICWYMRRHVRGNSPARPTVWWKRGLSKNFQRVFVAHACNHIFTFSRTLYKYCWKMKTQL